MRRRFTLALVAIWLAVFAPSVNAQSDSRQEWEQVLAAAKREGKVSVLGPPQVQARDVLTGLFQKKYSIEVEYLGRLGRMVATGVLTERRAQRYLWDVYIGGTTTGITSLAPAGVFDPVEPALILPEVKDPKEWRNGVIEFADRARLQLVFSPYQRGTIFINSKMVKSREIRSHKDFLDPKWKGKILLDDPRKPGPGQGTFLFFYLHPDLGVDFIRALGKQNPVLLRDYNQELDALGQGRNPILVGTSDASAEQRIRQGIPIEIVDPRQVKEGSDINPANGALGLVNRASHPNAARVYINWFLSKEGQTAYVQAMGYVSNRLDVPTDHVPSWRVPKPGAIKTYTEEALEAKAPLARLITEVFGR